MQEQPVTGGYQMNVGNVSGAFSVWTSYNNRSNKTRQNIWSLSTGLKTPTTDPAGLAISERMRAQYNSLSMASRNTTNAISAMRTSDSWMQSVNSLASRMKSLAVQYNSGLNAAADKTNMSAEFNQMRQEINRITSGSTAGAQFNGVYLLRGGNGQQGASGQIQPGPMVVQIGDGPGQQTDIELPNLDATNADVIGTIHSYEHNDQYQVVASTHTTKTWQDFANMDIGDPDAIALTNLAIDKVANDRATAAAEQKRLEIAYEANLEYESNLRAAESRIRDIDMARESTVFANNMILQDAGMAMLIQANQMEGAALSLL